MPSVKSTDNLDSRGNANHLVRKPGSSVLRRWLSYGAIFAGLILIVALMLPTILGSRWVYQPLLKRLEADNFKLTVESVHLSWFSPLELRGIAVKEIDGLPLVTVSRVQTDRGLLRYLLGGRRIGRIELVNPSMDIELVTNETNLGRLIDAAEGKLGEGDSSQSKSKPALDVDVAVRGFTATVNRPGQSVPLVIIPAFDVDLAYRAAHGDSHVSLQPAKLLDQVQLTPELIKLGLGYAIPLLAESAWFDGRISLTTSAIDIPLDDPLASTGEAVMMLHQVRSGPSEPVIVNLLDMIARLRNREPHHELVFVDGSEVQIQVADRRVHHQGLQFGLPKVDPRLQMSTSGTVGMADRALDLTLEFPVPVEQLARRDTVKEMGVPMIKLPIAGTLDEPTIQWTALREDSADLIGMIREKVKEEAPTTAAILGGLEGLAGGKADEAIAAAADLFQELRTRRQDKLKQQSTDDKLSEERAEAKSAERKPQPIRDTLRDLLRRKLEP